MSYIVGNDLRAVNLVTHASAGDVQGTANALKIIYNQGQNNPTRTQILMHELPLNIVKGKHGFFNKIFSLRKVCKTIVKATENYPEVQESFTKMRNVAEQAYPKTGALRQALIDSNRFVMEATMPKAPHFVKNSIKQVLQCNLSESSIKELISMWQKMCKMPRI